MSSNKFIAFEPDEPTYPNLRTLLAFDSKEFFNVLSLVKLEPLLERGVQVDELTLGL